MTIKFVNAMLCVGVTLATASSVLGKEGPSGAAATIAQAKAVIDLSGKPLVEASGEAQTQVAFQSFKAAGDATAIAKAVDQALVSRGLDQLAGATFTADYGSATYQKSGYHVNLLVMPSGEPNLVTVSITNQGNVDLKKLPKPQGTTELYVQPWSGIFVCDLPVSEANKSCRELLERDGWEWFGDTSASFFMRQNAVRLQVMCSESPAQQGKTSLQFSTELMSSALPLIPGLVRIAYADVTKQLDGDSKLSTTELASVYRKTLEAEGWKATTEQPIKLDFRESLIFRNEQKELAELIFHQVDSISRFALKFMTAAEIEAENQRASVAIAAAKKNREAEQARMDNPTKITIDALETTSLTKQEKLSLEFNVKSGTAQAVVSKWLAKQTATGWVTETTLNSRELGELKLTKGEATLSVSFIDPGFIAGQITIRTSREFQLEIRK